MSRCRHSDDDRAFDHVPEGVDVSRIEDDGPYGRVETEIPAGWWACLSCETAFSCEHPRRFLEVGSTSKGSWLICRCGETWRIEDDERELALEGWDLDETFYQHRRTL